MQLSEKSGKVQGWRFPADSLEEKDQSITLKEYESFVNLLSLIRETLDKWNRASDDKRISLLVAIYPAFENILQELNASEVNDSQMRADIEQNRVNLIQFYHRQEDDLNAWKLKSEIVVICVFMGVEFLLLGFAIVCLDYFRKTRPQDRPPRPMESRATPSRRRRR